MNKFPLIYVCVLFSSSAIWAADPSDPKFNFEKVDEKAPEWKVQLKGGLVSTTGNSQAVNGNFGGSASRKSGDNKWALESGLAYGRATTIIPVLSASDGNTTIDSEAELGKQRITATNNWFNKGRYDRFLSENNAAYVSGSIAADQIAGKDLFGGGQAGYSRQLFHSEQHLLVAELGYDFSYESYTSTPVGAPGAVGVHSARIFAGEVWSLSGDTGIYANTEVLLNLNKENTLNAADQTGVSTSVDPFKDIRVSGKAGITTKLWSNLSFGFSFTLRYDQNPAARPAPKNFAYGPGYQAFAQKLDTLTEANLIFTFL